MKTLIDFAQGGPLLSHNVCLLIRYNEAQGWHVAKKQAISGASGNFVFCLHEDPRPDAITTARLIREAGGNFSDFTFTLHVSNEEDAGALFRICERAG